MVVLETGEALWGICLPSSNSLHVDMMSSHCHISYNFIRIRELENSCNISDLSLIDCACQNECNITIMHCYHTVYLWFARTGINSRWSCNEYLNSSPRDNLTGVLSLKLTTWFCAWRCVIRIDCLSRWPFLLWCPWNVSLVKLYMVKSWWPAHTK